MVLTGASQSSILFNSLQFTIQFVVNLTKDQYEPKVQLNSSHNSIQCGPERGSIQFNSQIKSMWRSKFNPIHFNSIHSAVYCWPGQRLIRVGQISIQFILVYFNLCDSSIQCRPGQRSIRPGRAGKMSENVPRKMAANAFFFALFALFAPFALFALHFPPKKRTFLFFLTWSGPTANVSAWLARGFERTFYRYIKWLSVPKPRGTLRRCCKRGFLHALNCAWYFSPIVDLEKLALAL